MRRRTLVVLGIAAVPAAVLAYFAAVSLTAGILTITTDKSAYQPGETVRFTIRNNGFATLQFPNPGLGLTIMNVDSGEFVRTGWISPAVIHPIGPLQSQTISWDQTASIGLAERRAVEPGNYVATVGTAGGFEPNARAEVIIRIAGNETAPSVQVVPSADRPHLGELAINKSVAVAKQAQLAKEFENKFSVKRISVTISYFDQEEVNQLKFRRNVDGALVENPEFAFLNASSPAIGVRFFVDMTPIEENPDVWVYISPQNFEILSSTKHHW